MDKRLLEILVCPICKGELIYRRDEQELICRFDRLAYPIRDDIPVMLENEARKLSLEEYDSLTHTTVAPPRQGTDAAV
jgi:uncharacterized protein YbaR (Trm112 family)